MRWNAGTVIEVGREVTTIKPGQFVVGSFFASDNTCEICRAGYQTSCIHRQLVGGSQAELLRVPLADGTLVATPGTPPPDLIPSLFAASDVLGTGWFGAVAAEAGPGKTVAVVGDGAVGLLAVLAARRLGAERVIAMSRNADRQRLARAFGATDIVEERGDEGVARVKDLTGGLGAHSVVEAVGTHDATMQAIRATRPGGHVGYVGVLLGDLPASEVFFSHAHLHGGPAPVRRFLPELIDLIWRREIDPGKVLTSSCPSSRRLTATGRWTSGGRRRSSCGRTWPRAWKGDLGASHVLPPRLSWMEGAPRARCRGGRRTRRLRERAGYYAPSGDLDLYYGDVGYFPGIVRIGQFDGDVDVIASQTGDFPATLELTN